MADTAGPPGHGSGPRRAGRLAWLQAVALALALPVVVLPPRAAQAQAAPAAAQDRLAQAELEQLLAPIALHPDPLLMQMLMASTYPLEIVQAKRWLGQGQNASLRGDALAAALNAQPWDPSVKSLVPFPDVLTMMNDQLDWTQRLGDAVLAQQEDVMNAIQVLRGRAQAAGALQSGPQQTVTVTQNVTVAPQAAGAPARAVAPPPQTIVIAPAQPETVYVPAYNPAVVYGAWPYPQTPPYYYPPPVGWGVGNALLRGMAFAGGVAAVGSLWNWATPGWGRGDIDVNVNRYNNINVNRTQITGNNWQHDVSHRHGVAYRNDEVRNRVNANRPDGARPAATDRDRAQAREQFRGRVDQAERGEGLGGRPGDRGPGGGERPGQAGRGPGGEGAGAAGRGPGGGDRPGAGERRPAGADRPGGGERGGAAQRPAVSHGAGGRPQVQPAAQTRQAPQGLQGVGDGGRERAAAQRGAASREAQPAARAQAQQRAAARPAGGGGGGARAAGGGGGRGGRR